MDEFDKLSLIRQFASQIKKLPASVSSSFNAYLQSKYDLEELQYKNHDHPVPPMPGPADLSRRKLMLY